MYILREGSKTKLFKSLNLIFLINYFICLSVYMYFSRLGAEDFRTIIERRCEDLSLRDVHAQVQDSLGFKVVVSAAKSHSERGRVERKIRSLRESLERMGVNTNHQQTVLQWETLFSKIANTVDNLSMAKRNTSNATNLGYEIITPNRQVETRTK